MSMPAALPFSALVRFRKISAARRIGRFLLALACWLPGIALRADTLAIYSFTNATIGQTGNFLSDYAAPGLTASTLTAHSMDTVGVVNSFIGATDNLGYGAVFDGKGFAARASVLVDGGTVPEPTNNFVEFTLTPAAGREITITEVQLDFGLDDATVNAADTQAQYDLYLSTDGSHFTRIETTSTHSNAGRTYPGFTIRNDVVKTVTGFSTVAGPITFRLTFADSNSSSAQKRIFFDDVVIRGVTVPEIELQVEDAIAYEAGADHFAQFSVNRSSPGGALVVHLAFAASNLTNGVATFGADYLATATNVVSFSPGQTTKKIRVRPVDDDQTESPERIVLSLVPSPDYVILGPANAAAVLYDDEQPRLPVCFRDDFNTAASAANWTITRAQRAGAPEQPIVRFAYDYSADGIPPAPDSTDTLGLKIGFTNAVGSTPAVVNLFHHAMNCATDKYALSFYVYLQYDQNNSLPQHALAGINSNPSRTNFIYRTGGFEIQGEGQFVTLVGNDATNTSIALAHLWDRSVSTNALDQFSPGDTANQLLNNPPYGANGGPAGVLGCDVVSTNKTWLHCQLFQLRDLVQLRINGYLVLSATITNQNNGLLARARGFAPTALNYGAIMLGYLSQYAPNSTNNFAVFDNVELLDLDSIAITSMARGGTDLALNFYSQLSDSNAPSDFAVLKSVNGVGVFLPFTNNLPELKRITVPDADGFYGAYLYDEYLSTNSKFFQIEWKAR